MISISVPNYLNGVNLRRIPTLPLWTPMSTPISFESYRDASEPDCLVSSSGRVSQFLNLIDPQLHSWNQASASYQPYTGLETVNGHNVLTFPDEVLGLYVPSIIGIYSYFIVAKGNTVKARQVYWAKYSDTEMPSMFQNHTSGLALRRVGTPSVKVNGVDTPLPNASEAWQALVTDKPLCSSYNGFTHDYLSNFGAFGTVETFQGQLMAVVGKAGNFTEDELLRLEGWSAHKYGFASDLPDTHIYKNEPPKE